MFELCYIKDGVLVKEEYTLFSKAVKQGLDITKDYELGSTFSVYYLERRHGIDVETQPILDMHHGKLTIEGVDLCDIYLDN